MKKTKRAAAVLLGLIMALCMAACGSSGYAGSATMEEPAMAESASADYDGGYAYNSYGDEKGLYEEDVEEEEAAGGDYEIIEEPEPDPEGVDPKASEQKLIYTCDVTIETLAYKETMESVRALIDKYGGIIQSESTSDSSYNWYYSNYDGSGTMTTYMTVRIPTKDYRNFIAGLEGEGSRIRNKSEYVQNITRAYNDQSVLIESLEKQETRLMEMMDQAETIEEMIAVEDRLTEVQTELNQAKRALASMDTDIAYSTVNLSIDEVREYTPDTNKETFGERFKRSFSRSWSAFVEFLQDAVIALVYLLPFILLLGAIVAVVLLMVRRSNRKRAELRAAAGLPPMPEKKRMSRRERKAAVKAAKAAKAAKAGTPVEPLSPADDSKPLEK